MERRPVPRSPAGGQSGLPAADRGGAAARAAQDRPGHHAGLVRALVHPHLYRAFAGVEEGQGAEQDHAGVEVDATILDRFLASNEEARRLVERAGEVDVNHVRFKNPFVPMLRFTIGTGLEIIAKHQDRHLLQAERVRAAMR